MAGAPVGYKVPDPQLPAGPREWWRHGWSNGAHVGWGEIIDVIGIGAPVGEAGGSQIVCLSLERWTDIARLRVAYVRPGEAAEEPHDFPSYPKPDDWHISDDIGTQYEVVGGGGGGSRAMMEATIILMPTPRSPASELTINPPGRSRALRVALPEQSTG